MNITKAIIACFSPTQTTLRILQAVARGVGASEVFVLDLTLPEQETRPLPEVGSALVLIGAPVYAGRVPAVAERRLRRLRGGGAPAVVVAVYGNREYDDALLELRDLAIELGFVPVAGAAFVGEHSYSTPGTPIAAGRPDRRDLGEAEAFGAAVQARLAAIKTLSDLQPLQVPGNRPYKPRNPKADEAAPETREDLCIKCGKCAEVCPVGAVAVGETVTTDGRACILCCACTRACPTGARVLEHPRITAWREAAVTRLREPKRPNTFLADTRVP